MKSEKIIESWDKILPDEAADERMRSKIMEYQHSYHRKDRVISYFPYDAKLHFAACFVLVLAVTAFSGVQHNWFGAKSYTVTLDNGETLVYGNSIPKGKASYAYDYEVNSRALTAEEMHTLFPAMSEPLDGGATFIAKTGEMIRLEGKIGDAHIHLAKSGLPVTDTIIAGEESTAEINGIIIKTGYFVTDANSKGIKTAIFFAEFDMNDTTIYAELAGDEQDSEQISEKLSKTIYNIISGNAPDMSAIKFE